VTAIFIYRFYYNMMMALVVCTAVRCYWCLFPWRRSANEKVQRFADVGTVAAVTILLGPWLAGWACYVALGLLSLMYWSEQRRFFTL
jgi:hypothetical protein